MRLSIVIAISCAMIAGAAIASSPIAARELVIPAFPAEAVIRGENIRLRVEPASESVDVAILQRGDAITVTGESTSADGDEFYPVEVVLTGAVGWVRALAVDPRSITVSVAAPEVVETVEVVELVEPVEPVEPVEEATDDRAAEREARRAARAANAEPEPAPEPEPEPVPEGTEAEADDESNADQAARRAARQAERQANADADAGSEADAAPAAELRFNGSEPTVTDSFTVPSGVLTVSATHEGDGNFSVLAYSPDGYEELLFNETGPFSGQSALEVDPNSTLILDVEANGAWEVVIVPAF
jgi:hypothetical protein